MVDSPSIFIARQQRLARLQPRLGRQQRLARL